MIRSTIFIMHSSRDDKNYETHRISRYANGPTITWSSGLALTGIALLRV
jgi:hypothetical protein